MVVVAKRERDKRIQKLYDEGVGLFSISKVNTVNQCLYETYRTYIKKDRGKNGIYGIMGSKIHDKLEEITNGKATEVELLPTLQEELSELDMLNIDFPKDFKGGTSIRDNWIADMTHCCKHFVKPSGNFTTEELVIYKINDDRYMQGYIDLIRHNKDDSISIYDWKTSSDFKSKDLLHNGRQLVFYALAKEQEGFKVKNVAWIMLKYVEVSFMGKARVNSKKETLLTKVYNRGKLVKELYPYLETDLNKLGIDEVEADILLDNALDTNSLNRLPKEIQDKYTIKPYVKKYKITEELKQETLKYINNMADIFESKSDNENEWKPRDFTITSKNGKEREDTFYCHVLCNHRETCPHIRQFDELKNINKTDEDDLF